MLNRNDNPNIRAPFSGGIRQSITAARLVPLFALFLFTCYPSTSDAALPIPSDSTDVPYHPLDTIASDFVALFTDAGYIFTRPLRFDGTDWGVTGGLLGGTGLLMAGDESIRNWMTDLRGTDGDNLTEFGDHFGDRTTGLLVTGSIYLTGLAFNIPKVRVMGRHLGQSLAYSALATTLLKGMFGRHRPFLEDGAFAFEGPFVLSHDPHLSLPSGHATVAFAIAASLSADIDNPWATAGLYSAATLTALGRTYQDRHWSSDVLLGAVIGAGFGYGTANLDSESEPDDDAGTSWRIVPTGSGLGITYVW